MSVKEPVHLMIKLIVEQNRFYKSTNMIGRFIEYLCIQMHFVYTNAYLTSNRSLKMNLSNQMP